MPLKQTMRYFSKPDHSQKIWLWCCYFRSCLAFKTLKIITTLTRSCVTLFLLSKKLFDKKVKTSDLIYFVLATFSLIFCHSSSLFSLVAFAVSGSALNHSLHFNNSSLTVFSILPSSKVSRFFLRCSYSLATAKMKMLA